MSIALYTKKVGMTTIFDDNRKAHAVTVLSLEDAQHVISHKTIEKDGYISIQVSGGPVKKHPTKPAKAHYAKANAEVKRKLYECRMDNVEGFEVGTEVTLEHMSEWSHVDAVAYSKGKGFSGVMKAHNFAGQRASHGVSLAHRKPGSSGQCQDPGRVFPGKKMARRLGGERKTIQSLKVMKIDHENKLVIVKGAVPGPKGGYVMLKQALKKKDGGR